MRLRDRVWQALRALRHPGLDGDLVSSGLVLNVAECGGRVAVSLAVEDVPEPQRQTLIAAVEQAVSQLDGVRWVRVKVGR